MKTLLNTSFFFAPAVADRVEAALRERWVPAANAAGLAPATCLRMPPEEGIVRLAVQTPFASPAEAEGFRTEVAEPIAADLFSQLGAYAFTCFSTLMEIIDL
ncbi:MAG: hypothetical protein K2M40_01760 [Muribaculaceae bacterium]|nr:hypothetical protein [Muribaculaceae bacterium]